MIDLDRIKKGIELIKKFEGCKLKAYQDVVGIWTIGYGSTFYENGFRVREGDEITLERADKLLSLVCLEFAHDIDDLIEVELNNDQFCAILSLVYNIGLGAFEKSTLLKKINDNDSDAWLEFLKWNKAGGKVVNGLVTRRRAEVMLFAPFLKDDPSNA